MAEQSQWMRRVERLRSMQGREIADRIRQMATARLDVWRSRHGHDFGGEVSASTSTHGKFFFDSAGASAICGLLNERFPSTVRDIVARAEKIVLHQFDLLGYKNLYCSSDIDWHLDIVHDKRAPQKPWF